ncbi:YbgF trimerization domain-containing protein [Edaphosphingomonas haloaromaticamans]|uniref:Tol-pal system protein YbgF n=1 Tax=Edaphosphingomonas haloaromaticamans TaxID=653954 RepID=A0A1S1HBU1_9SPHN|nr:tetratricopeptide repeat protein [Sphingomonas haloaromaticamans]OHT19558.1 tol-pal system protein YbgF [Sphingomonas haloaromaticamans]
MRFAITAALLLATTAAPLAAAPQPADVGQRVDKLEREMRAVQRKVFPGGNQQYFEPEIAPQPAAPAAGGVPASNPLADLTTRVSSLEQELARLTGQIEQNSFKIRQIEEQMSRFKGDAEFRLNALEGNPTAKPGGSAAAPVLTPPAPGRPAQPAPEVAPPPPAAVASSRPASGDAGEDAYLAGYDLWAAKKYPEAESTLRAFIAKYPDHKRASFARNLLGRTLLDSGQPAKAAQTFLENYKKLPRGERAPDSLYYLGQSLMALKPPKPSEACEVYRELDDVYGTTIAAALKDRVTKARADAKCKS